MPAVKVIVRTRPTDNFAASQIKIDEDGHGFTIHQETRDDGSPLHNRTSCFYFPVHQVLHNVGQDTVYDTYCRDVVQGAVDGVNGTIFTYGQTGSGKTFTMIGDTSNYVHRGIAPRAIAHIFQETQARIQVTFKVTITYMEIYNERIYDLVDDVASKEHRTDFTIVEDRTGRGIFARGLTEHEIRCEQDALNLLFSGELRRTTAQHKLNRKSNRSHSILTIYIQQKAKTGVTDRIITSKLNIVDLAGSERLKKTMELEDPTRKYDETIKKESMHINQSLSYLEQCVVSLLRKDGAHVPYRSCKLTNLLKDSIGGNCLTVMIACIWGEAAQVEETISTLRFASRMTKVQNQTRAVEVLDTEQLIRKQEKLIRELKHELLMHDALAEKSEVVYDPYTPEQQRDIRQLCERYLRASTEEEDDVLVFQSLRQMKEMCRQFKLIVKDLMSHASAPNTAGSLGSPIGALSPAGASPVTGLVGGVSGGFSVDGSQVGSTEPGHGFVLGRADDNARPYSVDRAARSNAGAEPTTAGAYSTPARPQPMQPSAEAASTDLLNNAYNISSPASSPAPTALGFTSDNKERAYTLFKEGPGRTLYTELVEVKARHREAKENVKTLAVRINNAKRQIDHLHDMLEHKRSNTRGSIAARTAEAGEEVVDEEEFGMIKQERNSKRNYRRDHEQYEELLALIKDCEDEAEELRAELYREFEAWYADVQRTAAKTSGDDTMLDKLDTSEQFEKMEIERVVDQDPEALAYFQAQKTMRATKTQSAVALRQAYRSKRYPNPR